jgi:hypothetical protein
MTKRIQAILLVVALLAGLSFTGLALAQSSPSFDLGCWSVNTSAGGLQQSSSFRLNSSLGQVVAGQTNSPNFSVRLGYVQDWRTLQPAPGPVVTPIPNAVATIYLPVVRRSVRIVRQCSP